MNRCACVHVHTSQGKCPINDYSSQPQHYSQWYLALLIPGSRRNGPGAGPYCNCQLKIFRVKNNLLKKICVKLLQFVQSAKFPDLRYVMTPQAFLLFQRCWPCTPEEREVCLLVLTADGYLKVLNADTGVVLNSVFLSTAIKFRQVTDW